MSAPTPVTVRAITTDSGSARKATSTWNVPTVIQSQRFDRITRCGAGLEVTSTSRPTAATNEPNTVSEASQPGVVPRHRLPVSNRTAAPASGNSGISARRVMSALEEVGVVDVRREALSVQRDDDGQPHHDLRGGHDHDEERQDLSVQVPVLPGERHQGQVDRVQLELDGHEDDQGVPSHQDADGADGEQQPRHQDEVGDRRPHGVVPGASDGKSIVSSLAMRRRPCSIAPIAATMRRTLVASNGKKYGPNSTRARAWTVPPRFATVKSGSFV